MLYCLSSVIVFPFVVIDKLITKKNVHIQRTEWMKQTSLDQTILYFFET